MTTSIMCVRLNSWPIDRIRRKHRELRHKPLVLIETIGGNRQIVMHASAEAEERGVRAGMTLAQARALCPVHASPCHPEVLRRISMPHRVSRSFGVPQDDKGLEHQPYEPHLDHRALVGLGRWLLRFSPVVSPAPPDAIFIDVDGCERLYGSLRNLLQRVREALRGLGIHASACIAPTPGAAWAMAFATDGKIISSDELIDALRPLHPAALRLDEASLAILEQLGVETIEHLMRLPRQTLPARFGTGILRCLDAATGQTAEPLSPLDHQAPITAKAEFDWAVSDLEAIWQVLRNLVGQLIQQLIHRGCGVREIRAEFRRPYAPPIVKMIRLSRPSRDPANLFNLLRCALEMLTDNATAEAQRTQRQPQRKPKFVLSSLRLSLRPRRLCGCISPSSRTRHVVKTEPAAGFNVIKLSAVAFEKLSEEQLSLLEQERRQADEDLARLIELLVLRLGGASIVQAQPVESHLPERAYRTVEPNLAKSSSSAIGICRPRIRPLHLFATPVEVSAIVSPSEGEGGVPVSLTWGRNVHRLISADGPERIAGLWWEGRNKTRDYFDAEDSDGRRFWMFRVRETAKWYVHGMFE